MAYLFISCTTLYPGNHQSQAIWCGWNQTQFGLFVSNTKLKTQPEVQELNSPRFHPTSKSQKPVPTRSSPQNRKPDNIALIVMYFVSCISQWVSSNVLLQYNTTRCRLCVPPYVFQSHSAVNFTTPPHNWQILCPDSSKHWRPILHLKFTAN